MLSTDVMRGTTGSLGEDRRLPAHAKTPAWEEPRGQACAKHQWPAREVTARCLLCGACRGRRTARPWSRSHSKIRCRLGGPPRPRRSRPRRPGRPRSTGHWRGSGICIANDRTGRHRWYLIRHPSSLFGDSGGGSTHPIGNPEDPDIESRAVRSIPPRKDDRDRPPYGAYERNRAPPARFPYWPPWLWCREPTQTLYPPTS